MSRIFLVVAMMASLGCARAQESFGNTLNAGLGVGYYGYYYGAAPAIVLNYEVDIFRNFTLAPFGAISTYRSYRYWGGGNSAFRDYYYRETIIPIGLKGSYYLDELFEANEKWDFYLGASLGVVFHSVTWETGYAGDRIINGNNSGTTIFGALH